MTDEALIEELARAIAAGDGLNYDEICGHETDADQCDSGTCIAALCEDHDPDWSRLFYHSHAKAILPIIHRREIEAGERVREAASKEAADFWGADSAEPRIRALDIPAIVKGEG